MLPKVFLFVILAVTISCEAKKIKFAPSHPYIYNLELAFKEEKINDYIVDSFLATAGSESDKLLHCDIGLTDLIKAIPIKKLEITDFCNAYKELNLSHDDDDLNNLISELSYSKLKEVGISFEKIYKSVYKTYFKDRPAELLEALRILGIAEEFSVAYTFGSEEDIFNALQNGNFSYYNLVEIGNLVEGRITLKELFSALGLKKLDTDVLANFINNQVASVLIEKGLTKDNLKNFLQALGLSVSNYKESKSFKNCYNLFTQSKSLAVAVSNDELVTNDDSIVLKYLNLEPYVSLTAKIVQGSGIPYTILSKNIKNDEIDNVIRIKINGLLPSFVIEASDDADVSSQYCQYISVYGDQLSVQNINADVVDDQLTVPKFFNTPFKKGSPLICGQKLYGLASVNNFNSIIFDYVQQKQQENPEKPLLPVLPPIHNKPEAIQAIKDFFESIHANFNPCKYFDCGVKDEAEPCPGESNNDTTEESENSSADEEVSGENSSDAVTDGSGESEASTESASDAVESGEESNNNSSVDQSVPEDQNESGNGNVAEDQNESEDRESSTNDTGESDSAEPQEESSADSEQSDDNVNLPNSGGSNENSNDESGSHGADEDNSESTDNNDSANSEVPTSNSEQNTEDAAANSQQNTEEETSSVEQPNEEPISNSQENTEESESNSGQDSDVASTSTSEQEQQSNNHPSSGEVVAQEGDSNTNEDSEDNRESDHSSPENSSIDNSASDGLSDGNSSVEHSLADNSSPDHLNSP